MTEIIIVTVIALLIFGIWFITDRTITIKRIEQNQREWDEFSKDMTDREKFNEYVPFIESQRIKYGWSYYYLPKMKLKGENK